MLKLLERTDLTAEEKLLAAIFVEEPEPGQPFCEREIGKTTLECWVREIFDTFLREREKQVLSLRFGLKDGRARTLLEIGQELGMKTKASQRERPRQIEAKSLRKLRHPGRSRSLELFLSSTLLSPEERARRLEESKIKLAESKKGKMRQEQQKAGVQALWEIFQKSSFSHSLYCFQRIRESGITRSDLETLPEEEVVEKLDVRKRVLTKTEQCLRELWKIANSSSV